jgi:hypothetical protein
MDPAEPLASMFINTESGPVKWDCPTNSDSLVGRSLSARGAAESRFVLIRLVALVGCISSPVSAGRFVANGSWECDAVSAPLGPWIAFDLKIGATVVAEGPVFF